MAPAIAMSEATTGVPGTAPAAILLVLFALSL